MGVFGSFQIDSMRTQGTPADPVFILNPYTGYSESPPQEPVYQTFDDMMSMSLGSPVPPYMFNSPTTQYDMHSSPVYPQMSYASFPSAPSSLPAKKRKSKSAPKQKPKPLDPAKIVFGYPTQTPHGMHIPRPKRTVLSKDPSQALHCGICGQPFERGNSLRRHEQLHSGVKPYKCFPCKKEFSRRDIFRRHQGSSRCKLATEKCNYYSF